MKKILLIISFVIFLSCANKYAPLDSADRQLLDEIMYIATEQEIDEFHRLPKEDRADWLERFWKKRDPTPTTEKNERRIEHYERVKYTNDHFSLESASIPGWKTDIGRIYIKYGPPDKIEDKDIGLKQMWIYYSYGLRYRFDEFGRILHPFPGDQEYEVYINSQMNAPIDGFKLGGGKFEANFDYAIFYEQATAEASLEVYYEIPLEELRLPKSDSTKTLIVEERLAIFDTLGSEITKSVNRREIFNLETPKIVDGITVIDLSPGSYQLAFSLVDPIVEKTATFRKMIEVREYPDSMFVSNIQMAKLIANNVESELFQKDEYYVIPNPTNTYMKGKNLNIYYEIYNLKRDEMGNAKFDVQYTIRGKNLLWDTITFEKTYNIDDKRIKVAEALFLDSIPFDTYSLIVKVTDKNDNDKMATSQKIFNVVGWSVY